MGPLPTTEQLVELAMEGEVTDPIDWNGLNIDKVTAYKLMADQALSMYSTVGPDRDLVMLSIITKMIVENFILNLKLKKYESI